MSTLRILGEDLKEKIDGYRPSTIKQNMKTAAKKKAKKMVTPKRHGEKINLATGKVKKF